MMSPINSAKQVFDAIQAVKFGASAFCTNFFAVESKVQNWIEHGELFGGEVRDGAGLFFRKDRDFSRLYFCAASPAALQNELASLGSLGTERIVIDLVGKEVSLNEILALLEKAGFRQYTRLQRMARSQLAELPEAASEDRCVKCARLEDRQAVMDLLDTSFDRYADQLPAIHEMDAAIRNEQVLTINFDGAVAAVLFFETQGLTSTIRYWAVAERFRSRRFGAALMRRYLRAHAAVRRFVLWVAATNENAVRAYQHYGYLPDGMIDHVLANQFVSP